eukprot:m.90906 g.90906  ORF g.90906 m.90906 type:complete len:268 (+) comp26434_c1_seq1:284-1087(+)
MVAQLHTRLGATSLLIFTLLLVSGLFICAGATDSSIPSVDANGTSLIASNLLYVCDYVQDLGTYGAVLYIIILALVIIFCLPCTVFEIIPGFLFGPVVGSVVCVIGKNIGNAVCVILAKTVLAGYVKRNLISKLPNALVLERMAKRQGFLGVCIFRGLVYAPLFVKNYCLGALDIPASTIIGAAVLTGFPFSLWWCYLGSKAKNIVEIIEGKATKQLFSMPQNPGFVFIGVVVLAVGGWKLSASAKKAWNDAKLEIEREQTEKNKAR